MVYGVLFALWFTAHGDSAGEGEWGREGGDVSQGGGCRGVVEGGMVGWWDGWGMGDGGG